MVIESEGAAQRRIRDAVNIEGKMLVVQMRRHEEERLVAVLESYNEAMLFRLPFLTQALVAPHCSLPSDAFLQIPRELNTAWTTTYR